MHRGQRLIQGECDPAAPSMFTGFKLVSAGVRCAADPGLVSSVRAEGRKRKGDERNGQRGAQVYTLSHPYSTFYGFPESFVSYIVYSTIYKYLLLVLINGFVIVFILLN